MPNTGTTEHILLRPGVDRVVEIIASRHRRLVLLLLKQGVVETQDDVMVRDSDGHDEIEIPMVHSHLPRLDEEGYIDWDQESGALSKGPRFDEVEPLLDLIENHADELPPDWP